MTRAFVAGAIVGGCISMFITGIAVGVKTPDVLYAKGVKLGRAIMRKRQEAHASTIDGSATPA